MQSARIAQDYDRFVDATGLMQVDLPFVLEHLPPVAAAPASPPLVADLGCGTARVAKKLLPLGYRVLNLDLSQSMLEQAAQVPLEQRPQQGNLRVNLAQLTCLRPACLDAAVCLFSSLGMVRGRHHRRHLLSQIFRCLRPGSPLLVHVHNRYHNCLMPGGLAWLLRSRIRSLVHSQVEYGDRIYVYRGLPNMYLHIFSRREIVGDLRAAQFDDVRCFPLNATSDTIVRRLPAADLRAGGFMILAHKP